MWIPYFYTGYFHLWSKMLICEGKIFSHMNWTFTQVIVFYHRNVDFMQEIPWYLLLHIWIPDVHTLWSTFFIVNENDHIRFLRVNNIRVACCGGRATPILTCKSHIFTLFHMWFVICDCLFFPHVIYNRYMWNQKLFKSSPCDFAFMTVLSEVASETTKHFSELSGK